MNKTNNYPYNFLEECGVKVNGTLSERFNAELENLIEYFVFRTPEHGRNLEIIHDRYEQGWTLEEISADYGISRKRVRQIAVIAVRNMKKILQCPSEEVLQMFSRENATFSGTTGKVIQKEINRLAEEQRRLQENGKYSTYSIDDMGLPLATVNALHRAGLHTVGDLLIAGRKKISKIRIIGEKRCRELDEVLVSEYHIDMSQWNWK